MSERIFEAKLSPGPLESILRTAKERRDIQHLTAFETIRARIHTSTKSDPLSYMTLNTALTRLSYRVGVMLPSEVDTYFDMLISAAAQEGA